MPIIKNDLQLIYKYLSENSDKLKICNVRLPKRKPSKQPMVLFSGSESAGMFGINVTKPLLQEMMTTYKFVCDFEIKRRNWNGSYDDLIWLAKSVSQNHDFIYIEYTEKTFKVLANNELRYRNLDNFLNDIESNITHFYKLIYSLWITTDTMEVDSRNSIQTQSQMRKQAVTFSHNRLFKIASED